MRGAPCSRPSATSSGSWCARSTTQKWLYANPPEALADAVQGYFPDVPQELLRRAVTRYRRLGIWGHNPVLPRAGYERLKDGLVSGGFVKGTAYEVAVDNSLAEEAVADDPPALA
jgi:NitT/TauT family transport system substrate-binding protein